MIYIYIRLLEYDKLHIHSIWSEYKAEVVLEVIERVPKSGVWRTEVMDIPGVIEWVQQSGVWRTEVMDIPGVIERVPQSGVWRAEVMDIPGVIERVPQSGVWRAEVLHIPGVIERVPLAVVWALRIGSVMTRKHGSTVVWHSIQIVDYRLIHCHTTDINSSIHRMTH